MIVFLTVLYVGLLYVLTRTKLVPNNKWTWLTLLPYELILLLGFFIPMQWGAPSGDVRTLAYTVTITPNVTGEVIEVPVSGYDGAVEEGDVLFKIDPTQYQAALDGLIAQLKLAETRLSQTEELVAREAGSLYELQAYQAQVDGLKAQIANAEYNLAECVVRAPSDGLVTYVGLRPGARVSNLPLFKAIAFVDTSEPLLGAQVLQNTARYIEPGQAAEVTFKLYPGKVFTAKVVYLLPATAQGQLMLTGTAAQALSSTPGPFFVRLELDDKDVEASLPPGSLGSVAIYTSKLEVTHIIRKVMIRLQSIKNYVVPN